MEDIGIVTDEEARSRAAPRPDRRYARIEHHGVIGDLHTVALVDLGGTIDFLCWPRFDAPTVFGALLDAERGGHFAIAPRLGDAIRHKQIYLPDTNVLVTRFLAQDGLAEITDLMPIDGGPQRLLRIVRSVRGRITFDLDCAPRFDYARVAHEVEIGKDRCSAVFHPNRGEPLRLLATVPLEDEGGDAQTTFVLEHDQTATFLLESHDPDGEDLPCGLDGFGAQCFRETVDYWRGWTAQSTYQGRWREIVHRSGLILKLLTSERHGSIVAAPTFGLPEVVGGSRNWDYRFTWIRDAAFTLYALIRLGYTEEASAFVDWIVQRVEHEEDEAPGGKLGVLYRVDGTCDLDETALEHLSGYCGSRPVRIGNDAAGQLQLDIYGALMDAVYLANKYGCPISHDAWSSLTVIVDWVARNWERPDEGIWEFRGGRREFLHSRLMCWVCIDRALRLARQRSLPAPIERWSAERDRIYAEIFEDFWDEELGAFVQAKGSKAIDAACLLMPLVRFISPVDPR